MTADERLSYIEIRRREIALSRAMIATPDDAETRKAWFAAAIQIDEIYDRLDEIERQIVHDLDKILRSVDGLDRRSPIRDGNPHGRRAEDKVSPSPRGVVE